MQTFGEVFLVFHFITCGGCICGHIDLLPPSFSQTQLMLLQEPGLSPPCLSHKWAGRRKGRVSIIKVRFPHSEAGWEYLAGLRVCLTSWQGPRRGVFITL